MPENAPASPKRRHRERPAGKQSESAHDALLEPGAGLPQPGDLIGQKYLVERLIGRGGMGAVYEAAHMLSGKRVAVKWMLPALHQAAQVEERFLHEARATARIDHPNVVDIYDVGLEDRSAYLVMELLHGESLASRLARQQLTPPEAVGLLMPAMRGVAAAHAQGVIHRDLKPDNIFLCTGPNGDSRDCKVLDFGISKVAIGDRSELGMTRSDIVMGTPYYMSPEQIRGLNQVDERGDVYAFGVILYEMLADAYPYDAETYNALIVKIATTPPAPLRAVRPDLDPELVAIVMRAMAREREQRQQSVAELARSLEPFAQGATFRTSPGGTMPSWREDQPQARSRPSRRMLAAAALLLVCAVIASLALRAGSGEPRAHMPQSPTPAEAEFEVKLGAAHPSLVSGPTALEPIASEPSDTGGGSAQGLTDAPAPAGPLVAVRHTPRARAGTTEGQARPVAAPRVLNADWDEHLAPVLPQAHEGARSGQGIPNSAGALGADDL